MDANLSKLLARRSEILEDIQKSLEMWDGDLEKGIELCQSNSLNFKELQSIDLKLKEFSHPSIYSGDYMEKLKLIMKSHGLFLEDLKKNQQLLLDKLREIKMKDNIADSYIKRKVDSIFIDKDM